MGLLAVVALGASVATAEGRAWVGTATSFQGASITLRGQLRQVSATTISGVVRCKAAPSTGGQCLGNRADVTIILQPNGGFEAGLAFRRTGVICAALGNGDSYALVGQYQCARSGVLLDQGTLLFNRR